MQGIEANLTARIVIIPGKTRFRFSPRNIADSYGSQSFASENKDREGIVLGFAEEYLGPGNWRGREPGVYIKVDFSRTTLRVRFDGDEEVRMLSSYHLDILSGFEISSQGSGSFDWNTIRLRDLPEKVEFLKGDTVMCTDDLAAVPRKIRDISFGDSGEVFYHLEYTEDEASAITKDEEQSKVEIRESGGFPAGLSNLNFPQDRVRRDQLRLISRGMSYILKCGDPDELEFENDQAEAEFWSGLNLGRPQQKNPDRHLDCRESYTLEEALTEVDSGEWDAIYSAGPNLIPISYKPFRLYDRYARFRSRAQRATLAYWSTQEDLELKRQLAYV